jgi:hypothetical protein
MGWEVREYRRDSPWRWVAAAVVVGMAGGLSGLFGDPRAMLAQRRGVSVASWDNGTKCDRLKMLQGRLQ